MVFEPWIGGTPSTQHEGDMAHVQGSEEPRNAAHLGTPKIHRGHDGERGPSQ